MTSYELSAPNTVGRRRLDAEFEAVPARDLETGADVQIPYVVDAMVSPPDVSGALLVEHVGVWPMEADGLDVLDLGLRYRPGLRSTMGMLRAVAGELSREYPEATSLRVQARRVTDGFDAQRQSVNRDFTFPLTPQGQ